MDANERVVISDNPDRFARETVIVRSYAKAANLYLLISSSVLIVLMLSSSLSIGWLGGLAFFLCIVFSTLYQYFGLRFLVSLGTRYDLMPILKRSRLFQGWVNRPIVFYVGAMLSFYVGWLFVLWRNL